MDVAVSAGAAVFETVAFVPLPQLLSVAASKIWLSCFLIQLVLFKAYRVLVYPSFISPLRKLPGPKV